MSKARKLTATFADGTTIKRTTFKPNIAFAWRAMVYIPWSWGPDYKADRTKPREVEATGWSSSRELAAKAIQSAAYVRDGQRVVSSEIVEAQ